MKSAADPDAGAPRRLFAAVALTAIVLDQITKFVAEATLLRSAAVSVFGDWAQLRLVYNQGAAFGLHVGPYSRWVFFAIALIAGGAAGNLIDRIRSARGVVDFIDVGIGAMRWPTFNIADIAVTCGAIALAVSLWREDRRPIEADSAAAS